MILNALPSGDTYLSLIIPCYNEETTVPLFYDEVVKLSASIDGQIEFIFVDDGSQDNTLRILRQLADKDSRVHYISFSRNFGKEAAMLAGLQAAKGKYTAILDSDLQHPPSLVLQMLNEITNGEYDCIAAKRTRKGDSPIRSLFARIFYKIIQKLSNIEITDGVGDFRLMTKEYVNAILKFEERNRFSKGIYPWVGFRTKCIEYENIERTAGNTKWSFWKLFMYSLDGIIAFSSKPLAIASLLGVLLFLTALALVVFIVIRRLIWGDPVDGWASTVCIILFCSGIQLFTTGILGQYVAKTYTEVKQRPHFIVQETR